MDYTTRELTNAESEAFVRKLHVALGNADLVNVVLRAISESHLGIFAVEPK